MSFEFEFQLDWTLNIGFSRMDSQEWAPTNRFSRMDFKNADFKIRPVDRICQNHNFQEKHIFDIGFGRRDLSRKLNWVGVLKIRPVIGEIHGIEASKTIPIFSALLKNIGRVFKSSMPWILPVTAQIFSTPTQLSFLDRSRCPKPNSNICFCLQLWF